MEQIQLDKIQEYEIMKQAGIPVPKWVICEEGQAPDLSEFDDYLVTKPAAGCRGAFVRIMHRSKARWRSYNLQNRRGKSNAVIIQKYIHTGPRPTSFRVATFFGEPFYAWRMIAALSRKPFPDGPKDAHFFEGRSIVSSGKGCVIDQEVSSDVIQLAVRVHQAFPDIPLLAIDIIRDFDSGELYVLELNTAALNAVATPNDKDQFKINFGIDSYVQFGGAKAMVRGLLRRLKSSEENSLAEMVSS